MDLAISRFDGPSITLGPYPVLLRIRLLAVKSEGFNGDAQDLTNEYKENFEDFIEEYSSYRELLFHSDCEGLYIPEAYYPDNIESHYIGNYDRLREELIRLNDVFINNPELYEGFENTKKAFDKLFNLVLDETKGEKILLFH